MAPGRRYWKKTLEFWRFCEKLKFSIVFCEYLLFGAFCHKGKLCLWNQYKILRRSTPISMYFEIFFISDVLLQGVPKTVDSLEDNHFWTHVAK